jgi:hypothetical protein
MCGVTIAVARLEAGVAAAFRAGERARVGDVTAWTGDDLSGSRTEATTVSPAAPTADGVSAGLATASTTAGSGVGAAGGVAIAG